MILVDIATRRNFTKPTRVASDRTTASAKPNRSNQRAIVLSLSFVAVGLFASEKIGRCETGSKGSRVG